MAENQDIRSKSIIVQALLKPVIEKYNDTEWEEKMRAALKVYSTAMRWTPEDFRK